MKAPRSYSRSIPVPIGGWNARDPLEDMKDTDAVRLINIFPANSTIELRGGFREHTSSGLGSGAVETLAEWSGASGTKKLIAGANGNLYDCTTIAVAATDLTGGFGAFTSNRWQTAMYKNTLIFVNGTDQPKQYDGTTVTDATYTGTTDNDFIAVNVYKERLYFVQKDSMSIWYGGAGNITGAVVEFPVGDFARLGGYILFAGSYTRDTGKGFEDLFVIVTNMGEVLAYSGLDPSDTEWGLVGHYYMPPPISRRSFFNYNADLVVVTYLGAIPLSRIIDGIAAESDEAFVTNKIRDAFRRAALLYKDNFGWDALVYPQGASIWLNIPTSSTMAEQYVVNIQTGAWTRYTGQNARCWTMFNDKPYFGGATGKIFQADYGTSDNGADIMFEVKPAFNYFGDREQQKFFSMVRPIITAEDKITLTCIVDTDFRDRSTTNEIVTLESLGAEWDVASWDTAEWVGGAIITDNWYSVGDIGRCGSVKLSGLARDVAFSISALDVVYESGGFF